MLTEVTFLRIATDGVWQRGQSGAPRFIYARTAVIALGRERRNHLCSTLQRLGRPHRLAGGAHSAGEFDGARTFREDRIGPTHCSAGQADLS
jgi:hypothetical protein